MATESCEGSAGAVRLDSDNPWPGLPPYDEASREFFHGRDTEAAELLRLIRLAPLTVLYGKSGLGKTSLLQAGLFPLLRAQHFLPVYWRPQHSGGATDDRLEDIAQRLTEDLHRAGAEGPTRAADEGVWEYLHRKDFEMWSSDNFPLVPVLVLDQFEELFSQAGGNAELVQRVFDSLADLIENRIPAHLASDAATPRRADLDLLSQHYRILLSFREDYLPDVKTWEEKVPSLLRNCLRLGPMTRQRAIAAVEQAGTAVLDEGVAPLIVDFVGNVAAGAPQTDTAGAVIEPVLLSLCCYQLNLRRRETQRTKIDRHLVTTAGQDILANFYREALEDDDVKGPPDVARFIEDYLVQGERFRGAYPRAEALDEGFVTAKQLACLVARRRLLRVVPYEDTDRIELIHDRLVSVVCKARDDRREREQRAALEQKTKEAEARAREKEQNNRRLIRWRNGLVAALAVSTVALALCVAVMLYAWHQQRRAMAYAAVGASYQNLRSKPQLGTLLALQAMSLGKSAAAEVLPRAENVVRRALNQPIQFSLPHTEKVTAVAFSPDGRTLAAASGTDVHLWDPQTGQAQPHNPMRHPSEIKDLAFIADGSRIVSGDTEGNVKLWNTQTGEDVTPHPMQHGAPISSLALGPGDLLATASLRNGSVILWNITTGERVGTLPMGTDTHRWVSDLAWSPDGTRLAVGDVNMGVTTMWDLSGLPNMEAVLPVVSLPNWKPGKDGATDARTRMLVDAVAFSHDGKWLATGDRYNAAHLWAADTASHRHSFLGHSEQVLKVALSPDDSRLATGSVDATATIWDTATGRFLFSLSGHDLDILDLAFSPDGGHLATASRDKTVKVWNIATHSDAVDAVAFSPDGKLLATGSGDATIKIWKTESRALVRTLVGHEDRVLGLAFSPNGEFLASVSFDKTTRIWDVATGKEARQPPLQYADAESPNDKFYHVAYSPDGRWVAAAGANFNAVVWDAASGALLFAGRHGGQVSAVAFNPPGTQLVSVGWDGLVKIWEIPAGTPVASFESPGKRKLVDVRFDPTGHRLIMATGTRDVLIMDVAAGQMTVLNTGPERSGITLTAQFTPNGTHILTTGVDAQVRIRDAATGREIRSLAVHTGRVNDVAVSRDGYWVATAGQDGTFTVSPFDPDQLVAVGCARVGRNLNDEECGKFLGVAKCPAPPPCDRFSP